MAFSNATVVPERFESIDNVIRRLNKALQKTKT